jgi:hypothetical protein
MEVISSIIYHFQSYVYMAGYTSAYLNYKFSRVSQKRPPKTHLELWARSNGRIETYGHFDPLLKSGWPNLLVTEVQFQSSPKENGF